MILNRLRGAPVTRIQIHGTEPSWWAESEGIGKNNNGGKAASGDLFWLFSVLAGLGSGWECEGYSKFN